MKDTGKKINILKKLALIADALDEQGLRKEANSLTTIMLKMSQQIKPNYFALAGLPPDGSGYTGTADQNEKLRAAISKQHNTNFPDFYSAYQKAFGTFTKNMEDRKKNLRGDATNSTVPVANPAVTPQTVSNLYTPSTQENNQDFNLYTPSTQEIKSIIDGMTAVGSNSDRNKIFKISQTGPQFNQNVLNNNQIKQILTSIAPINKNLANEYGKMGLSEYAEFCIKFSGDPLKMYETVYYGNLYANGLETYTKSVYDAINKVGFSKLTGDVQIELRSKFFEKPIKQAKQIAQIMQNVTNYAMGLGAGNGSIPVLEKLNQIIAAMEYGAAITAPQKQNQAQAPQEQLYYNPEYARTPVQQ